MTKPKQTSTGSARVRITPDDIIECVLEGDVTGPIVRQSVEETAELARVLQAKGKPARLLIVMDKLTSQDSGARSEAKKLSNIKLEKIAVYGARRTIRTIGQYIARIAGMHDYTKFFIYRANAITWLKTKRKTGPSGRYRVLQLCTFIIALIGVAGLIGWVTNNYILRALSPSFTGITPTAATSFILVAIALSLLIQLPPKSNRRRVGVLFATGLFLLSGFLGVVFNYIPPITALLYGIIGGLLLLVVMRLEQPWMIYTFRLLTFITALMLLVVFIGYGFDYLWLYHTVHIQTPLMTAIGLIFTLVTIVGIIYRPTLFPIARRFLRLYWAGITVFVVMALLTSVAWQQTKSSVNHNSDLLAQQTFDKTSSAIQARVNSYIDALRGFKAFFESSSFVEANEYESYFNRSELKENYPGFNTISLIRYVPAGQKQAFETQIRQQAGVRPELKNFTIKSIAHNPSAFYVATYLAPRPTAATGYGTGVGALQGRIETFQRARDLNEARASEVVTFNTDSGGQEEGFIITIPIYKAGEAKPLTIAERQRQIYGFVNAVFRSKVIFKEIFSSLPMDESVAYRVQDVAQTKTIYENNTLDKTPDFSNPRLTRSLNVGGREWQLAMQTTAEYGKSGLAASLSSLVLSGGLTLAFLSALLVVSLSRRREEALLLASNMTEDLNNERNTAEAVRQKDEAVLASIGDAVFAIDMKECITLFNPAATAISGYSQNEALGRPYDEILPFILEKDGKTSVRFITRALKGYAGSMKDTTLLRRKDGSTVAVADSAAPIRNAEGKIIGVIVVFRDVSKERELDKAKSEFVSLASHQLRTPLSAINWYGEMLLEGDAGKLNETQLEYMKEIYHGNQRMIELVDSLLNVSRLEVGKLKNDPSATSMIELADSLEKEMQTSIISKKMKIERLIPAKLPTVFADPKLLRMVVQNLLSNAIKYTPEKGNVTIEIRRATSHDIARAKLRDNQEYLFLRVSDTGYGIPKEQQAKIFGKLFRADNVRRLDVEGTGLGLYIVKEIAKKLGGDTWVESTENVGTTFYVLIPFKTKAS